MSGRERWIERADTGPAKRAIIPEYESPERSRVKYIRIYIYNTASESLINSRLIGYLPMEKRESTFTLTWWAHPENGDSSPGALLEATASSWRVKFNVISYADSSQSNIPNHLFLVSLIIFSFFFFSMQTLCSRIFQIFFFCQSYYFFCLLTSLTMIWFLTKYRMCACSQSGKVDTVEKRRYTGSKIRSEHKARTQRNPEKWRENIIYTYNDCLSESGRVIIGLSKSAPSAPSLYFYDELNNARGRVQQREHWNRNFQLCSYTDSANPE